ncbi:MAG: GNAT family N-acetyltransferase [Oscillospiraceae bacterium]
MIRKGTAADLDGCAQVYEEHLNHEAATVNYTNWLKGAYPTRATAEKALAAGTLYVDEEDGVIVGCANLNHIQPAEYANIPWSIPAEGDEVLVIHTLVFRPTRTGGGRGRRFVAFAEALAKEQGCKVIRLDTYEGNEPAKAFYPKLGYHYAGLAEFFFEKFILENLVCYEKAIQ